jgi:hypothetical protein
MADYMGIYSWDVYYYGDSRGIEVMHQRTKYIFYIKEKNRFEKEGIVESRNDKGGDYIHSSGCDIKAREELFKKYCDSNYQLIGEIPKSIIDSTHEIEPIDELVAYENEFEKFQKENKTLVLG